MTIIKYLLLIFIAMFAFNVAWAIDTYNPANNQLSIPSVQVGGTTYTDVVVTVGNVISIGGFYKQPIKFYGSSYENMKNYGAQITLPPGTGWLVYDDPSYSFAVEDFMQNGETELFTTTLNYTVDMNYDDVVSNTAYLSDFTIWKYDSTGNYTTLFSCKGCLHPRKALVADFNNDGFPDIFVSCTGWDGPAQPGKDWAGEQSKLLLNTHDGKFTVIDVGNKNYFHGSSAADINGDGYPDIVVADVTNSWNGQGIYALINNKDGTFTIDKSRFPKTQINAQYVSIELVDIDGDGLLDVIVGSGQESSTEPTMILWGDSTGKFGISNKTIIPIVDKRGVVLDFTVLKNSNSEHVVYVGRTSDLTDDYYYHTKTVQLFNVNTLSSSVVFDETANNYDWVAWWLPIDLNGQPYLVPFTNTIKGVVQNIQIPIK